MRSIVICLGWLSLLSGITWAAEPHWIWSATDRAEGKTVSFATRFSIDQPVTSAVLRVRGESANLKVDVNEQRVSRIGSYDPPRTIDLTERLPLGEHRLSVEGTSVAGPPAFFVHLNLTFADGTRKSIVTDERWSTDAARVATFGRVSERLLIPEERGIKIHAVDNYDQWKQAIGSQPGTDPASFLATPGFEVRLIRTARTNEDSWVSLAIDPQGRPVIAQEKQGLLRMTLSEDGASVTKVERINESLEECRGLLFAFGNLFANANNSKGLYRLRDDGNDQYGDPELLYASSGGVGHGRNDLALGPDGKIYMIHGDAVDLPEEAIDYTSPFREARQGKRTREGHLLRIHPDGGSVEVLAAGLRNPFGIDFNVHGEVFTYDADAEYDMGSPWYRPTRVNHLVTGGDYGWRGVTKSWPSYYPDHPDNALPNLDIGKGSPTAVKFGTRSNFPRRYREALFILDWTYGRIIAVHATPRGSSYGLTAETFLKGRPLNVTDLDFAPDGSMLFVTGGRGTQSALYRVRYVGDEESAQPPPTPQQEARFQFARESRELRHRLESLLRTDLGKDELSEAWQQLSNADPWIQHAARNVLEHADSNHWRDWAFAEQDPTTAVNALLILAREKDHQLCERVLEQLNRLDWPTLSRGSQHMALYTYWLCLLAKDDLDSDLIVNVGKRLDGLFPQSSYPMNRLLSEMLVALAKEAVTTKTVALLKQTDRQVERMHYLYVLRNARQGWTLEDRRDYFAALQDSRSYLGGQGMPDFLRRIRAEATATLSEDERAELAPLLATVPKDAEEGSPPRPFVKKWTVEELTSLADDANARPDLDRGKTLFAIASCSKCHRMAGRGGWVGPDLTSVRSRFSRRDLLESIILPSKVVAEKYRSIQVMTKDGQSYIGQPALGGDYRSTILRLATNPDRPSEVTEISKLTIEAQRPSPVSWMPEGLLNTLTQNEILDLLAYIEAGGEILRN